MLPAYLDVRIKYSNQGTSRISVRSSTDTMQERTVTNTWEYNTGNKEKIPRKTLQCSYCKNSLFLSIRCVDSVDNTEDREFRQIQIIRHALRTLSIARALYEPSRQDAHSRASTYMQIIYTAII